MSAKNLLRLIARTLWGAARTGIKTSNFQKIFVTDTNLEHFEQGTFF